MVFTFTFSTFYKLSCSIKRTMTAAAFYNPYMVNTLPLLFIINNIQCIVTASMANIFGFRHFLLFKHPTTFFFYHLLCSILFFITKCTVTTTIMVYHLPCFLFFFITNNIQCIIIKAIITDIFFDFHHFLLFKQTTTLFFYHLLCSIFMFSITNCTITTTIFMFLCFIITNLSAQQ
ncbi:hypothetical protein Hanom_Chr17g01530701 [Helianthus anomalus]